MRWNCVFVALLSLSCGVGPSTGQSKESPEYNDVLYTTKALFRNSCSINDDLTVAADPKEAAPVVGLLAAIAPSLVEVATGFVASWLEKRSKEYSETVTTEGSVRLTVPVRSAGRPEADMGCLVVVGGEFANDHEDGSEKARPKEAKTKETWDKDKLKALNLRRPPDFFFELWMSQFNSGHIKLEPKQLFYSKQYSRRIRKDRKKDLLINITFSAQSLGQNKECEVKPILFYAYHLPNTKIPSNLASGPLSDIGTKAFVPAIAAPCTTKSTEADNATPGGPAEVGKPPVPGGGTETQFGEGEIVSNVQVTILETEDGGDLLLALSNFIRENKNSIDQSLVNQIQSLLSKNKGK